MKKLFLTILCLCMIFSGFLYINSGPVYAEQEQLLDLKFENGFSEYSINFKNNINSPYDKCKLNVYIDDTNIGEPNDIIWSYKHNDTENTILFDGTTTYEEAIFSFAQVDEQNGILSITSLVAGKIEITATVGGVNKTATLTCNYATNSPISIEADGETELNYEDLTSIILSVNLEYENFMENNYSFVWYLKNTSEESKIGTGKQHAITQSNITPGEHKIIVVVKKGAVTTEMMATKIIKLKTTADIKTAMTVSGNLELDLDSPAQMEPIIFTVTETNVSKYYWYLLTPASNVFVKQETTSKMFSFPPTEDSLAGTYKVFAQVELSDENKTNLLTDITEFNIKAKEITDEVKFTITTTKQANSRTGVQSCKCEINTNGYYDEESIIWFVNGSAFHKGSSFTFEPTLANEYILSVKLVGENDKPIGEDIATTVVSVEATTTVNTWIIISIAFVTLAGICVGAIIISNKCREKIW